MPQNTEKFKYISAKNLDLLPQTSGVYCFVSKSNVLLYIGKAINIKARVKNHFIQPIFKDNVFIPQTRKIGFIATGSEIEALLLEAILIKKFQPKYNTIWKDGKSYYYVFFTKEEWPRVFVAHQSQRFKIYDSRFKNKKIHKSEFIIHNSISMGPFVDGTALKQTLRVLRRVFPYRMCRVLPKKPCLYKELGLCLAPCWEQNYELGIKNYEKNIKNLIEVLRGKKTRVLKNLQKEMQKASVQQNFEKAKEIRDQIFALENVFSHSHILNEQEVVKLLPERKEFNYFLALKKLLGLKTKIKRIEGYDISNIQGQQATGSMVVFENGAPNKSEYRKFKIKITGKPNDTAMIKEILNRRLKHKDWPMPQVMLIDGGKAQLNAAIEGFKIYDLRFMNKTKIIALAKRKNELFIENQQTPVLLKNLPQEISNLILYIRDEAHRFAITYHKNLRSKKSLNKIS